MAEDIASDTFLTATQAWGVEGIPKNPTAWLYAVAKNKASNALKRSDVFANIISQEISDRVLHVEDFEIDLSPQNINDSQLQMMFAIVVPNLSPETQIGLSLRILCGFGIGEIADAFLTTKEVIHNRLFRAKEKLREQKSSLQFTPDTLDERLPAVLTTIYLMFNEGYHSHHGDNLIRKDLCLEALRLCTMLAENESTNTPEVNALLALMCFHFSRFDARISKSGTLILYDDQDTALWNSDFILKGGLFLTRAARGNKLTKYHLEAGIAYWSTQKTDSDEKWERILQLYNQLLELEFSPIAALNRAYALSKVKGKTAAIGEVEKLTINNSPFYFALLGELYIGINPQKAKFNLQQAIILAKTEPEKNALQEKLKGIS